MCSFYCHLFTLFPLIPEIEELMKVSDVAPLVVYLCHESCADSGSVLETAGGWAAKGECILLYMFVNPLMEIGML